MNPSDARVEHLLQEAGWLRNLARNLVEPSRVDDVVQDIQHYERLAASYGAECTPPRQILHYTPAAGK
jgi:hypothetical protein